MRYRIVREKQWSAPDIFRAQYRTWRTWWRDIEYRWITDTPIAYDKIEDADDAIQKHKKFTAIPRSVVLRPLGED